jgi:eukaryotic-like serine/threonine-protein kinase
MSELTRIGDYEVHALSTAAGVVRYRATHVLLPRVAMIELSQPAAPRAAAIRLMRQACILEALHHPGVPRVFECGVHDGQPWVAYEPSAGVVLETELRAGKLGIVDVVEAIEQVATILTHAHARGVLHRNVTPASIVRDPHRGHLVLADWTAACTIDSKNPGMLAGKCRYRAPELSDNHRWAEGRADVFSLGMIALQALAVRDARVSMRAEDIPVEPPALANLIAEMIADVPALRPSAAEVVETLRTIRREGRIRNLEDLQTTEEYAAFELAPDIDRMIDVALEEDASRREPTAPDKARIKPRWTPQWRLDSGATVPRGIVEIAPRRRDNREP